MIMCSTYTDKLLHLALLHALLELALLVGVETSQSVRIRDGQLLGVNPTLRECEMRWDICVHLIHGCCGGACVCGRVRLDGFVGCEYGRLCVDFGGRMRRKKFGSFSRRW